MSCGIGLAFCVLITAMVTISPSTGRTKDTGLSRVQHFFINVFALAFALLAENAATSIIKISDARPRPSAFYICNFQGYQEAVDSGDFTLYNSLTTAGAPANVECVLAYIHINKYTRSYIYLYIWDDMTNVIDIIGRIFFLPIPLPLLTDDKFSSIFIKLSRIV